MQFETFPKLVRSKSLVSAGSKSAQCPTRQQYSKKKIRKYFMLLQQQQPQESPGM